MSYAGTLITIYQQYLARHPNAVMLVQDGQAVSYEQFDHQVHQTAAWLLQHGIQPGDHVAVWLVNRTEWLVLLFAIAKIGATLVAVNTKYRALELQFILTNSQRLIPILWWTIVLQKTQLTQAYSPIKISRFLRPQAPPRDQSLSCIRNGPSASMLNTSPRVIT
jgi:acyl-CoA synthetase (AMP-forming)/AMP-acid ligase II